MDSWFTLEIRPSIAPKTTTSRSLSIICSQNRSFSQPRCRSIKSKLRVAIYACQGDSADSSNVFLPLIYDVKKDDKVPWNGSFCYYRYSLVSSSSFILLSSLLTAVILIFYSVIIVTHRCHANLLFCYFRYSPLSFSTFPLFRHTCSEYSRDRRSTWAMKAVFSSLALSTSWLTPATQA